MSTHGRRSSLGPRAGRRGGYSGRSVGLTYDDLEACVRGLHRGQVNLTRTARAPRSGRKPPRIYGPRGEITDDGRGVFVARGERIALRTLAPEDLVLLDEWAEDPFLERMVGSELLRTFKHVYDKHASFYDALLTDPTQVVFVIVSLRDLSKPVGLVRFFNIHLIEGYAFLETIISDPRAIRRGYGVEASKLLCAYGLDVLDLHRIEAKVYEYNTLSINSLRRNGFRLEGVLRKAGYNAGERVDVLVFGILREELEAQRRKEVHQEYYHFPFAAAEGGPGGPP